ncbi:MAG: BLUF domain-containing protein [Christiangramia sp.]|nr:BLUF domain-containing protein [Christiangramia sp.]
MRHVICYVSHTNSELDLHQIQDLLDFSLNNNRKLGLKGVLLYSEGNFFQILEGEKEVVLNIYHKIEKDPRHHGIIQIIGRDISKGAIDGYTVDVLNGEDKYNIEVPKEYLDTIEGIPLEVKKPMENMVARFVSI